MSFNLYSKDAMRMPANELRWIGVNVSERWFDNLRFADDIVLIATSHTLRRSTKWHRKQRKANKTMERRYKRLDRQDSDGVHDSSKRQKELEKTGVSFRGLTHMEGGRVWGSRG